MKRSCRGGDSERGKILPFPLLSAKREEKKEKEGRREEGRKEEKRRRGVKEETRRQGENESWE